MKISSRIISLALILSISIASLVFPAFQDSVNLLKGSSSGNLKLVKLSLQNGANVNVFMSGYPGIENNMAPLMLAAKNGHLEIVTFLLSQNAIISLKHKDNGKTALDFAREKGHDEIVSLLEKPGNPSSTRAAATTSLKINSASLFQLESVTPSQNSFVTPGTLVKLKFTYDFSSQVPSGPATLKISFDHKGGPATIDVLSLSEQKSSLALSYHINELDLCHTKYDENFKIHYEVLVPHEIVKTAFKTLAKGEIIFKDGQKIKTPEQKKYLAYNYIYPNRVDFLTEDKELQKGTTRLVLKKGEMLTYFPEKYLVKTAVLKKDAAIQVSGNTLVLAKNKTVFFSEQGDVIGGTLAQEAKIKSQDDTFILKKGSAFQFNINGILEVGTLGKTSTVKVGSHSYTFTSGSTIGYFPNGNFRIATTASPMAIYLGNQLKKIPSGTMIRFNEKGSEVYEIYNAKKTMTFEVKGKNIVFDKMHGIIFYKSGKLQLGLLEKGETFEINGQKIKSARTMAEFYENGNLMVPQLMKNTPVKHGGVTIVIQKNTRPVFFENGLVKNCILGQDLKLKVKGQSFIFRKLGLIQFRDDGSIQYGNLAKGVKVNIKGKNIYAAPKSTLYFDEAGNVTNSFKGR